MGFMAFVVLAAVILAVVVRDYNTRVQAFPSRAVASVGHFRLASFFEIAGQPNSSSM